MFRRMLAQLLERVPQARAAIFCDHEGESVDWAAAPAGRYPAPPPGEYEVRLCGAQLAAAWILIDERARASGAGAVRALELRAAHGTLLCQSVQEGYYLVLVLADGPGAPFAARALQEAARAFADGM